MTDEGDTTTTERVDWDAAAAAFDDEPDHGLRDPGVRAAWADRLRAWLPGPPADVLDSGGVSSIRPGSRRLAPRLAALSSVGDAPHRRLPPPCDARHQTPLPDPA
jgi:hypothetical protein